MQDPSPLTEALRNALAYWFIGILFAAPYFIKNCIAIFQLLKKRTSESVTRTEFEQLREAVIELRDNSITRPEFMALKETLQEIKKFQADQNKTLTTISIDTARLTGEFNAKHKL